MGLVAPSPPTSVFGEPGRRLGVLSHSPTLPPTSSFISSLMSPSPLTSTQGLLGDLLCSPGYPCLLPSSFHPCPQFLLFSHPCPLLSPLPGPSQYWGSPIIFLVVLLSLSSPVPAVPVYLSPSYTGSHQRPRFFTLLSDFLLITLCPAFLPPTSPSLSVPCLCFREKHELHTLLCFPLTCS